jgi:hypothetical protein
MNVDRNTARRDYGYNTETNFVIAMRIPGNRRVMPTHFREFAA